MNRSVWKVRPGDGSLSAILASDFFGAFAGSLIHLTMIWWVLSQNVPDRIVALMVLAIFVPLNVGVLLSGVAVVRYGSRRLLIFSKLIAVGGAFACFALLASGNMTLILLAIVATVTYAAMGPSLAADVSRVPAITRLAGRRLAGFHASNGIIMVLGQVAGLGLAGYFAERTDPHVPVAAGVGILGVSALITWGYFPRDRLRPRHEQMSAVSEIKNMSAKILARLDGKVIGVRELLAVVAIMAVTEGCVEVILPLAFRASELPPIALSGAYVLSVFSGILAAVIAQAIHEKIRLLTAVSITALLLAGFLICALVLDNMTGVLIAVAVSSAAAWGAGTIGLSSLQENMPVSLQAQAVSIWQTVVLAAGAGTILIAGQIGSFSMLFVTGLALLAVYLCAASYLKRQ